MKILVAESISPAAVALLQQHPEWNVTLSNPKEFEVHLEDADALLVRSAVKVTRAVLEKARKLRVIGRAGVGVDNVDLAAATEKGVLVMNTPGGNAVSVAEHTLALMLSMARSIPQASASTKSGKWEKKKFLGNELRGKTLGVVGLGSIGREVVLRAKAFEMKVLACDPYVTAQTASDLGVELVSKERLLAESDYISLHVALTPETRAMLDAAAFARMKDGVRIVNCARGELIDEAALAEALQSGKVAGAALDVFSPEPPKPDSLLFALENVIATPHIAGSTEEAQEIVGIRIVEQVVQYLTSGVAVNAVNMPAISPEQFRKVRPYLTLAERLGHLAAHLASGNPQAVRIVYRGSVAELNTQVIRNAGLAGVLNRSLGGRANVVNAMQLASQRGLGVAERHEGRHGHIDSLAIELETASGVTSVEGAVILERPRLIQAEGIECEALLSGHLLYLKNDDVPGVIGHIGTVLGAHGINIANFSLGRENGPPKEGKLLTALALVDTDAEVPEAVLEELRRHPAIHLARTVNFPD